MLQGVLIREKEEPEMKEYNNTVEREDELLGKKMYIIATGTLDWMCGPKFAQARTFASSAKVGKTPKTVAKNKWINQ